jgi:hypothetical protein
MHVVSVKVILKLVYTGTVRVNAACVQEFWFTAVACFLYFTAFVAQLAEFSGTEDEEYQYWIDAQVTAGVSPFSQKSVGAERRLF